MATIPISRQPPWLDNDGATAKPSSGRGASGSSTNFTFLNHSITISPGCELQLCFHQFQELPLELRENIWAYSLPQQRLLTITVTGPRDYNAAPYSRKNNIGNIVSDASYRLHLDSTGIYTPQLYVNQEANRVTKRTYRVRVPRIGRSTSSNPSRLCFSPERDTILVTVEHEEDKAYFAHFVHDALAYDPQQKGILHMAIMSRDRSRTYLPIDLPTLHRRAQIAMSHTLTRLESVRLVHLLRTELRQDHCGLQQHCLLNDIRQTVVVRFNRAYPLWSTNASYSILPADPRPVSRYLDLVDCGLDPRSLIRAWRLLEEAYEVTPTTSGKIRVVIAVTHSNETMEIATTSQACWYREQEELSWERMWEKWGFYDVHFHEWSKIDTEQDLEFSKNGNAVGFWEVPVEAFGEVPDVPFDTHRWQMSMHCDFTAFESEIKLGLFDIT